MRIWDTESSTLSCCRSVWLCGQKLQPHSSVHVQTFPHIPILSIREIQQSRKFMLCLTSLSSRLHLNVSDYYYIIVCLVLNQNVMDLKALFWLSKYSWGLLPNKMWPKNRITSTVSGFHHIQQTVGWTSVPAIMNLNLLEGLISSHTLEPFLAQVGSNIPYFVSTNCFVALHPTVLASCGRC